MNITLRTEPNAMIWWYDGQA